MMRLIVETDIPELFSIRTSVKENLLSMEDLKKLGITPESVAARLRSSNQGYIWEEDGRGLGFAISDKSNAEMWVIAVRPEYEGRGIGGALLAAVEQVLWDEGHKEIWLTTSMDPRLKAYSFYKKHGWVDDKIVNDVRYMKKTCQGS